MIIVYSSNTGHTAQYAELLSTELGIPAYELSKAPAATRGMDAIYLGWLMAGNIVGYRAAAARYNVRAVVGSGITPESDKQTGTLAEKVKAPLGVPVFYLQGGYDYSKLKGANKAIMTVMGKKILANFKDMTEEQKAENIVYRMLTKGDSAVSAERLAPVVEWYRAL